MPLILRLAKGAAGDPAFALTEQEHDDNLLYLEALGAAGNSVFTPALAGLVPAPVTTGTLRFLREDGQWFQPPAADGTVQAPTDLTYDPATRTLFSSTGADVVLPTATQSLAGMFSGADKKRFEGVYDVLPPGADYNSYIAAGRSYHRDGTSGTVLNGPPISTFGTLHVEYVRGGNVVQRFVTSGATTATDEWRRNLRATGSSWTPWKRTLTGDDLAGILDAIAGRAPADHAHASATTTVPGFMSTGDKSKLDEIATEATKNATDAFLLSRINHTEKMPIAAIDTAGAAFGNIFQFDGQALVWVAPPSGGTGGGISVSWDQAGGAVLASDGSSAVITLADFTYAGLMSPEMVDKLANIAPNATAQQTAAQIRARLVAEDQATQIADGKSRHRSIKAPAYAPVADALVVWTAAGEQSGIVATEAPPGNALDVFSGNPATATYDTLLAAQTPYAITVAAGKAVINFGANPTVIQRVNATAAVEISALAFPTTVNGRAVVYPQFLMVNVYNTGGGTKSVTVANHASAPPTGATHRPANGLGAWALPSGDGGLLSFSCMILNATQWSVLEAIEIPA